ncbi:MAG: hypothetical protein BGP24_11115 [Lysobacterales bacterium 69-70]|nr:MAG: hypothetical protein BGP24_11115 [Xanthomonadales bacterium 69-70]
MPHVERVAEDSPCAKRALPWRYPVMPTPSLPVARLLFALFLALTLFPAFAAKLLDETESLDADAQATALVVRRLAGDDLAPFHRVEAKVADGIATLTGTARTRQARDAIVSEVRKIAGVSSVQDRIEVQPAP